ncbi:MAG TPA: hypothetical protein VN783_15055 [Thermoanaerobaculia bacterium]|nr:hypothetical protein [Thermoanaerobaculia bacterium]
MKTFALAAAAALLLTLGTGGTALAQNTPVGLWTVNFFVDDTPSMFNSATQQICFLPDGSWYFPTFGGVLGRWFQKGANPAGNGDRVRVLGSSLAGSLEEHADLDFINLQLMTGPWTEWRPDLSFKNWTQATFNRIAPSCPPAPNVQPKAPEGATATSSKSGKG